MRSGFAVWRRGRLLFPVMVAVLAVCVWLPPAAGLAQAQGGTDNQGNGEEPRRDFRMGTTGGNMYMGKDAQGNSVMEIRPRAPAQQQQQPYVPPVYVFPQVAPGGPPAQPQPPVIYNPRQQQGPGSGGS